MTKVIDFILLGVFLVLFGVDELINILKRLPSQILPKVSGH